MPRLRVLHLIQNLNYGGMERLLSDIARSADRDRFETHILAFQYLGRFAQGLEPFAELHLARPMSRWSMLRPTALASQIRAIAPHVAHTHSGVWYKGSLAARQAGVPFVVHTEHGRHRPDPWIARAVDGVASRRTDVVVAVSESVARQLVETVVANPLCVRVVANGVDTEIHRPRPDSGSVRRALGIDASRPIVGSIGRLEPVKGYDVMLEAFVRLRERCGELSPPALVIAGDGRERARLEASLAHTSFRSDVQLLGWRDDVAELHSAFTLFTMSSRSEGTSVSLLEAMSAGICPVVTEVGGNATVLGPALRHRLVPSGDPESLALAWMAALTDDSARRADGRAARSRVEAAYSLEHMVRCYEELYLTGVAGRAVAVGHGGADRKSGNAAVVRPPALGGRCDASAVSPTAAPERGRPKEL